FYSKKITEKKFIWMKEFLGGSVLIVVMKKLILLTTVLIGAATASQAQVALNFGFGIPLGNPAPVYQAPPVYAALAPVCNAPAPVYTAPPVTYAPAPTVYFGFGTGWPYYRHYYPYYHRYYGWHGYGYSHGWGHGGHGGYGGHGWHHIDPGRGRATGRLAARGFLPAEKSPPSSLIRRVSH